jgi:hypothetical protein
MRVVVANEESEFVEIDTEHGRALRDSRQAVYPSLTISGPR